MRVTPVMRQLGLATALLAFVALTAGACSKSSDTATTTGTTGPLATIGTTTPDTAATGTKTSAVACSLEVVQPLAEAKYPGITVTDLVCSTTAAVATLKGPGAPGGDGVAFFVVTDGTWTLVAEGPAADVDTLRPKTVPTGLVESWRDKRNPPPPPTTRVGGSQGNPSNTSTSLGCYQDGDALRCPEPTTTTTRPPTTTTTTTAPPPTEPPPTEPPPTDPPTSESL